MFIRGCIPFSNKTEKKNAWKQLKQEFGDAVKIIFHEDFMTYSCKVDRNFF